MPVCIAPDPPVIDTQQDAGSVDASTPDPAEPDFNVSFDMAEQNNDPNACPEVTYCGEQEPNDREDEAVLVSEHVEGCANFGFDEYSFLHQDSVCANDIDQFLLEYMRCDAGGYKIIASLTTPGVCLAGGELRIAEGMYSCDDEWTRCEQPEPGVERITIIVNEGPYPQPVEKIRFAVRPGAARDGTDYILRVMLTR